MDDRDHIEDHDDELPSYQPPDQIDQTALSEALCRLTLLGDDMFLRMQVFNLRIVDQFVTHLEYDVLRKLDEEEHTPLPDAAFLGAQSQMWIFAAYEIMRTWRQRAKEIIKWSETGGLAPKLKEFEKDLGYLHVGRRLRADQIKKVMADPSTIERIKRDLKLTHIIFAQMEALRISMAKHEVAGRKNSVALRPGYGRINQWCGSLDYELENGIVSMGYVSRRDIAEGIRALLSSDTPPTDEEIAAFDQYMRGPDPAEQDL